MSVHILLSWRLTMMEPDIFLLLLHLGPLPACTAQNKGYFCQIHGARTCPSREACMMEGLECSDGCTFKHYTFINQYLDSKT